MGARITGESMWGQIYAIIQKVPAGYVATYGQIAALAGMPGYARQVGYALSALPESSPVPWHRVVNASGKISIRSGGSAADLRQRARLEAEGVEFDAQGRIPLEHFQWRPERSFNGNPGQIDLEG